MQTLISPLNVSSFSIFMMALIELSIFSAMANGSALRPCLLYYKNKLVPHGICVMHSIQAFCKRTARARHAPLDRRHSHRHTVSLRYLDAASSLPSSHSLPSFRPELPHDVQRRLWEGLSLLKNVTVRNSWNTSNKL
jgi:hypothetical protein